MWSLSEKPKTMRVTPALAREFSEMDPAPHDRPLSERRLQVYERLFSAGGFRPCTWAKATCSETGGMYRVNGKHTSTLLAGLKDIPEYYVTIENYACDTLEDVARLYSTFDSKTQSRTSSDINLSFAATVNELVGLPARLINLAVSGMAYSIWQDQAYGKPPAERAELLLEHPEFVLWLQGIAADKESARHLRRAAVVAAMFGSWQKAKAAAEAFWCAVRDETGNSPLLADRKLARYLLTTSVDTGNGAKRVRKVAPREFYVKCIHAWNAWRNNEATDMKYYPAAKIPALR